MNKKLLSVIFVLFFLACIGVMDYPFIARIYNERVQGDVITSYDASSQKMDDAARTQSLQEAQEYNQRLAAGNYVSLADAFGRTSKEDDTYENLLNTEENGVMAVVEIPAIQVSLPVYHGTSESVLQLGAGHLEGSSLPVGGADTHTCISAHRGLPSKKMFTSLDLLKEGDIFFLHTLGEKMAYEIYRIETVTPERTEPLHIQKSRDLATLITCTPYGINTHRLYVHGTRIPYKEAQEKAAAGASPERFWDLYWWAAVTVLLLLWMCILLYRFNRKDSGSRKNKQERKEEGEADETRDS